MDFVDHLWSGEREPAHLYIQGSGLPMILTMAGSYSRAMSSVDEMREFVEYLCYKLDQAADMDCDISSSIMAPS